MATVAELKNEHEAGMRRAEQRKAIGVDLATAEQRLADRSIEKWRRRADYPRYLALSVSLAQVTPGSPSLLMNPW